MLWMIGDVIMKTILLRHNSWLIVHDSAGWPSDNCIVFKEPKGTTWDTTQRIPKQGVAYCSNIKSALVHLFQQSIINKARSDKYNVKLKDLIDIIDKTKDEFTFFLTPKLRREIKKILRENLEVKTKVMII